MAGRGGNVLASRARSLRNGNGSRHRCVLVCARWRPTGRRTCNAGCVLPLGVRDGSVAETRTDTMFRGRAPGGPAQSGDWTSGPAHAATWTRRLRRRPWLCCRTWLAIGRRLNADDRAAHKVTKCRVSRCSTGGGARVALHSDRTDIGLSRCVALRRKPDIRQSRCVALGPITDIRLSRCVALRRIPDIRSITVRSIAAGNIENLRFELNGRRYLMD